MSYELHFKSQALKEWKKLDAPLQIQFKKKLAQRVLNPKVASDKLHGYDNVYKIKLRSVGYRLAYEVQDDKIIVLVLKIGKRDKFYNDLLKL